MVYRGGYGNMCVSTESRAERVRVCVRERERERGACISMYEYPQYLTPTIFAVSRSPLSNTPFNIMSHPLPFTRTRRSTSSAVSRTTSRLFGVSISCPEGAAAGAAIPPPTPPPPPMPPIEAGGEGATKSVRWTSRSRGIRLMLLL